MKAGHYIVIFGGAVAGSEAASELSKKGIRSVIIDQFPLPYGKLETGLPKWHSKLRDLQEKKIDDKLKHPLVKYIPNTKLGSDIKLSDCIEDYGFTAVLLATGAWRDRPLPIEGIDQYIGKGLIYQNSLVGWFNKNHDTQYDGPEIEIQDNALIIGGGLASIDVAKILVIETTRKALHDRGISVNALELEHKGIHRFLEEHDLTFSGLGLVGPTLFTRHNLKSMPLTPISNDASEEEIQKAYSIREKILTKVMEKFPFRIVSSMSPVDKIVEDGKLTGIKFSSTIEKDGKFVNIPGSETEVNAPLIISAIGSIPESIEGLSMKGEIYDVEDIETGKVKGYENVFALGNAVTGRGNIRQSQIHSRQVSENIVDQYLVWQEEDYQEIFDAAEERVDTRIGSIMASIDKQPLLSVEQIALIEEKLEKLEKKSGYSGDYDQWISDHLPPRLKNS